MELPGYDSPEIDRRVVTARGEGLFAGRAYTYPGRFYVEYEDISLFTSADEILEASLEVRTFISGIVAGSTPMCPEDDEALQVWRIEMAKFQRDGRHWPYDRAEGFEIDDPSDKPAITHRQLAPAAKSFLALGATELGWSKTEEFATDMQALIYGVSSNKRALEFWRRAFNEAGPRPGKELSDLDKEDSLLTEWGSWGAVQSFLEHYPEWESIERVISDIDAFSASETWDNPWWSHIVEFQLLEQD